MRLLLAVGFLQQAAAAEHAPAPAETEEEEEEGAPPAGAAAPLLPPLELLLLLLPPRPPGLMTTFPTTLPPEGAAEGAAAAAGWFATERAALCPLPPGRILITPFEGLPAATRLEEEDEDAMRNCGCTSEVGAKILNEREKKARIFEKKRIESGEWLLRRARGNSGGE